MKQSLITVIVPVYNVENYLPECIESVLLQTYSNLEVILVDDGSTDDSGKIADNYAKEDKRIKVIHKENAGLGFARNSGLEIMTGDFVMFLDSDDYLELDFIEKLYLTLKEYNVDLVKSGYVRFYSQTQQRNETKYKNKLFNQKTKENFLIRMLGSDSPNENNGLEMGASACLYDAKLIKKHHIRFPSEREIISEDFFFNVDFVRVANSLYVSDILGYFYRYNINSLTKKYRKDRFEASKRFYEAVKEKMINKDSGKHVLEMINKLFMRYVRICVAQEKKTVSGTSMRESIGRIKAICSDSLVQKAAKNCPEEAMNKKQKVFLSLVLGRHSFILYILANIGAF